MATATKAKVLLVIDRQTGEVERIPDSDPNFGESIVMAGHRLNIGGGTALQMLSDGQELVTAGFIRRFE